MVTAKMDLYLQIVRVKDQCALIYIFENLQTLLMFPRQYEYLIVAIREIIDHLHQLQHKLKKKQCVNFLQIRIYIRPCIYQ